MSALAVRCPSCNSAPGMLCTQPDSRSRHVVTRTHFVREHLADDIEKGRVINAPTISPSLGTE